MTKKQTYAPVKPARSFEEQAQRLLEVHNLDVKNDDRARHILSTVNYYRLTTYGKHLRRQDNPELFLYCDGKIDGSEYRSCYFMPGDWLNEPCDDRDAIRAEVTEICKKYPLYEG